MFKRLLILSCLVHSFYSISAQEYLANVVHYDINEGLSNRVVFNVHQDQKGFIWIGTKYGLNRFDGVEFTWFTKEKNGLADNSIHHILEDDAGMLWLFTGTNWYHPAFPQKVALFNTHTQTSQSLEAFFGKQLPFKTSDILRFMSNNSGELFFGVKGKKLYAYSSKTGFYEIPIDVPEDFFPCHSTASGSLWGVLSPGNKKVTQLLELSSDGTILNTYTLPIQGESATIYDTDDSEKLWFSIRIDKIGEQLFYLDKTTNTIHPYKEALKGIVPETSIDWSARIAFRKKDQSIWFKNEPDLIAFYPEKDLVYDFSNHHPEIGNAGIQTIYFDQNSSAWIGTAFGLYRVELNENPFSHILSMDYNDYELNNAYSCRGLLATDRSVFVNTYKGRYEVDKFSGVAQRLPNISYTNQQGIKTLLGYFPLALFQDREEEIWFSDYTLIKRNLKNSNEIFYTEEIEYPNANNIWSIYQDKQQQIWVGTEKGIGYLDTVDRNIKLLAYKEFSESFVYAFVESKKGHVWVCTSSGLYAWMPDKGIISHFSSKGSTSHHIPHDNVFHLHEDTHQQLWLATGGGGLIMLKINNQTLGIDTLRQFTITDGLSHNTLYAVYEDREDLLWMSSDFGIIQFDKKTHHARAYLPKDGVTHHEFNRISHYQGKDGKLYFGSLNGVTAFYPSEVTGFDEDYNVPLQITSYQQFIDRENKVVDKTTEINETLRIILQPGDRFNSLEFALLEYINTKQNRYRYKLTGLEEEGWNHISENSIHLSALPYGNYTLVIQGQGADGRYSGQELQIAVMAVAPFYVRLWFIICSILAGLSFFYTWYKWRTKTLRKNQFLLEQQVKKRTKTIEQQAKELRELDQMKSRFFTNVSHELRTPLTLLLGPLDTVMKSNKLDKRNFDLLKIVHQNGDKLLQLVNEILDLSKLESSELALIEKPVVIYSFIHHLLAPFLFHAQREAIELIFIYEPDQQIQLLIDGKKIKIIIDNLLSNALKFTEANGAIHVTLKAIDNRIQIRVKDTGRGIHPDDLPHIFNRFYQSKQTNAPIEGGTGIGLALSMELTKLMKGNLWVESEPGKGSTFFFEFPARYVEKQILINDETIDQLKKRETPEPEKMVSEVLSKIALGKNGLRSTILIVEDNYAMRNYLDLLLSTSYTLKLTKNGQEALDYLQQLSVNKKPMPDLILSDVMMPIMDGFTLLNKLKSQDEYRGIPVIMLTARAEKKDKISALRIGVDDYMIKPFDQEELYARISNAIRNALARSIFVEDIQSQSNIKEKQVNILSKEDSEWLRTLEQVVLENLVNTNFSLDWMANQLHISKRQLSRKVKKCTGLSPAAYLKEARLIKARSILEAKSIFSVKELSYAVGISNADYFGQQFKDRFGKLPSDYL